MAKPIKILIVEDDVNIRSIFVEVFRKEGFEVEEAEDGVDGLDKATKNPPDIVFTGIIVPRMDGFALKEALSKNVTTSNIPVVFSSHMGRKEDEEKARALGVKDFIFSNMITPRQTVERIRIVLGSGEYRLKFHKSELDALKLAKDLHFNEKFQCSYCGTELEVVVRIVDLGSREFNARFVCPKCNR